MQAYVWDLPTRLFHWLLVVCVIGAFVTAKIGGGLVYASRAEFIPSR